MDKIKQKATQTHRDGTFQEFRDLLTKTAKNANPGNLKNELKTHIKRCEDMLHRLQLQDRLV